MSVFSNKFLLNILACGLFLSSTVHGQTATQSKPPVAQTKAEWANYKYPASGFSVDFPKKPEHVQQSIDVPRTSLKISYETYLSEPSDNAVYVVSVWNYPTQVDMSKPEVNLQEGFKGMLSALSGSEVKDMKMVDFQGFKALEFLVKNQDIFFQGRLILVHNTLYQVFTVYKQSEDMSKDYKRFIDSFKLIDPDKRKPDAQQKVDTKATPPQTKSAKYNL